MKFLHKHLDDLLIVTGCALIINAMVRVQALREVRDISDEILSDDWGM